MRKSTILLTAVFALASYGIALNNAAAPNPQQDWHLHDKSAGELFQRSHFAHGYMHGYEVGYHHGDQAFHVGQRQLDPGRALRKVPGEVKRGPAGSKDFFRDGFDKGFHAGYIDAFSGREFRAVTEARLSSPGVQQILAETQGWFDSGYRAGYRIATSEVKEGKSGGTSKASQRCSVPPRDQQDGVYCEGYHRGYKLGYSDAQIARLQREIYTASK